MTAKNDKTLFGHPIGLFVLFFTEMWERFSYYGMRALLILYMTKYLIKSTHEGNVVFGFETLSSVLMGLFGEMEVQQLSSQIYGLYTGLVYFTPLFGGLLADRLLGQRKTVVIGGVLMAFGHFLMAFESLFLVALFFIILGNGAFKPNISTQVGNLYPKGDPRRDSAFTIFYMGINLGAWFAPFVCGTLGEVYGWHYGFTAAGVGMVCGLLVYLWGQKYLAEEPLREAMKKGQSADQPLTAQEWRVVFGLIALCALNVVFWAVFEQQGNTMALFAYDRTDWSVGSWTIPSTWLQSFNPMFMFLTAPFLIRHWERQGKRQLSSVAKMSLGCILLGLSFIPLIYITNGLPAEEKVHWLWFVPAIWILTVGELYLSPIGLSLVTKVAPVKIMSLMMGMWFLSSFFGNFLSGYIGTFYSSMSLPGFFTLLLVLGVIAGIAIFVFQKPIKSAVGRDV